MLAMGKTNPLNMKKGKMKKNTVIMACCWVAEIVEMNSPVPRVLKRKRHAAATRSRKLPLSGMENHTIAKLMTIIMSVWAIMI